MDEAREDISDDNFVNGYHNLEATDAKGITRNDEFVETSFQNDVSVNELLFFDKLWIIYGDGGAWKLL